jgi:hypothetical protein
MDQNVTGEELPLGSLLFTGNQFHDVFLRNQNIRKEILHARRHDSFLQRSLDLVFEAGICMYHIPLESHLF